MTENTQYTHLDLVIKVIVGQAHLRITYTDIKGNRTENRVIAPSHLCIHKDGAMYVTAYDRMTKSRRNFAVARMENVELVNIFNAWARIQNVLYPATWALRHCLPQTGVKNVAAYIEAGWSLKPVHTLSADA